MSLGLLLLLAYAAVLVWALRQTGLKFDGPWWFHLRAFWPNWKFYHAVGWMPRLMVRHRRTTDAEPGEWQMVYPRRQRHALHLWHNPDVNLALSLQNLVDHLANDIALLPDDRRIEDLPVYALVHRHAAHHLLAQGLQSDAQFQLQLHLIHPIRQQTEIALNAPWSVIASRASSPPRP